MRPLERLVKDDTSQTDGKRSVVTPISLRDNLHSLDHIAMHKAAHPILTSTALASAVP